jgi:hypothetical protein
MPRGAGKGYEFVKSEWRIFLLCEACSLAVYIILPLAIAEGEIIFLRN